MHANHARLSFQDVRLERNAERTLGKGSHINGEQVGIITEAVNDDILATMKLGHDRDAIRKRPRENIYVLLVFNPSVEKYSA